MIKQCIGIPDMILLRKKNTELYLCYQKQNHLAFKTKQCNNINERLKQK